MEIKNRVFILAILSLKNAFVKLTRLSFSLQATILKVDISHIYYKDFIVVVENIFLIYIYERIVQTCEQAVCISFLV